MKQRTRLLAVVLAASMCASAFAFTACGDNSGKVDHTHASERWRGDSENHWKICDECSVKFADGPHSFVDGVCSVCGKDDGSKDSGGTVDDPPAEYDPSVDDKATDGLDFKDMKDSTGKLIGYRVVPGENFDLGTEELFIPQRHNNLPVLCIGIDTETYTQLSESGMGESELNNYYSENTFSNCPYLTTVHLGREITEIGARAFSVCQALTDINIPERVERIGLGAFGACGKLETMDISASRIRSIGNSAFQSCASLKEFKFNKRLEIIEAQAFSNCIALESLELPDSLQTIQDNAFENSALKSIDLGEGVMTIGARAFSKCSKLESIEIPDSVLEIGESCFTECLEETGTDESGKITYTGLKNVKIGRGLETIPENMFQFCFTLETVELTSTKFIGEGAFSACQNLTSINFGDSLIKIESSAFWSCLKLTELVFPDSLAEIGNSAFMACSALKTVEFGAGISFIDSLAFDGCRQITKVVYHGTYEDWHMFVRNSGGIKEPTEYTG